MDFKFHIKKKTSGLVRVCTGHGLTRRVDMVLSGCCPGLSFIKPRSVQPSGRPTEPDRVL